MYLTSEIFDAVDQKISGNTDLYTAVITNRLLKCKVIVMKN